MTLLVTGGTGFVGSRVIRVLLEHGNSVRALVRPASDLRNLGDLEVEQVLGDLREPESLRRAIKGCQGLFHVGADYRLWTRRPADLYDSNVEGTRNLMEAALDAGVERIVYTSSVATLGLNKDGTPADEATPVRLQDMIGHYKRSKYLAEEVVSRLIAERGLPAVIVNPSTPIGPGDIKPTPTGRVIRDAVLGTIPAFVDTGLNVVHVDDVARGHWLAYEKGQVARRYILGGEDMPLRQILAHVAHLTHRKPPSLRLPHAAVMPFALMSEWWAFLTNGPEPRATVSAVRMAKKLMYFDSNRAVKELGYSYRPGIDALADAVRWFTAHAS